MKIAQVREALLRGERLGDMSLRVVYYARVSTDKDEQLHSLSAQKAYYDEKISANPNWSFAGSYIDEGRSATKIKGRESFLRMINDAERGIFDFILTKEISRFSRNTLDSISCTQQLLACGVGVLFESDGINTLMPDAELRLAIMSSIAQDEVRKTSERVRFGFRRAQEKGIVLGNNNILGYRKSSGKLVPDEREAELVCRIFDLYANRGLGIGAICDILASDGTLNSAGGRFSYSSIRGVLTNPKYKGFYCGGKSKKLDYRMNIREQLTPDEWLLYSAPEIVPPLVSSELWERANSQLSERSCRFKQHSTKKETENIIYSGLILCAVHGKKYRHSVYKNKNAERDVWQCPEYSTKGRTGCLSPAIYGDELNMIVRNLADLSGVNTNRISKRLIQRIERFSKYKYSLNTSQLCVLEIYINDYFTKDDYLPSINNIEKIGYSIVTNQEKVPETNATYLSSKCLHDIRIVSLLLSSISSSRGIINGIINIEVSTPYRGKYRGDICRKRGQTSLISLQYI